MRDLETISMSRPQASFANRPIDLLRKRFRQAIRSTVMSIAVLLLTRQTVYAELPVFPANSIAPLYGKWENAMGKGRVRMSIGSKWIATLDGWCPQRSRYQVLSIAVLTREGENSLSIIMKLFGAEFTGKYSQSACSIHRLEDAYLDIELPDQGSARDAPIGVLIWRTCDTLEHLKEPVDLAHPNVKSCGAGGGIMDRVTRRSESKQKYQ